jgi:hypothetical protein
VAGKEGADGHRREENVHRHINKEDSDMRLSIVKKTVMATALAVASAAAVAGAPSNALALGFNFGDVGFFVYGGNDQRYENFGPNSALPTLEGTSLTTRDISGSLSSLNVGATTGLRYSIMGTSTDGLSYYVSSTASTITPSQANNSFASDAAGNFLGWAALHAAQTGGASNAYANNPSITSTAVAHSFTSVLGTDGSVQGQLGFTTHGTLGQLLNIFRVNIDGEAASYVRVASAILGTNGQLTITPTAVPIPAAVYLFGTGLVALVGIARRSMNKNKLAA